MSTVNTTNTTYEKGRDRYYFPLFSFLLNAMYSIIGVKFSRIARFNQPGPYPVVGVGTFINLGGETTNINFTMTGNLLDSVLSGKIPQTFSVEKFGGKITEEDKIIDADDIAHTHLLRAIFVSYYESVLDDIEAKFGPRSQYQNWPVVLRFGRVIRNAFAHGGQVHITGQNAQAESWRIFSYGPADNGTTVLFNGMGAADLIELMEEMDIELR